MARPARILFEGAYYHVMHRGQGKRRVYLDTKDYKAFLNVLSHACGVYGVNVVAYCLMENHYHLLVHTPRANLPDFMRQVNGVYTQIFNQRYKTDGSLFRGRYKANVVQEGSYLMRLIRYIHRNPVRAGMVKRCGDYTYSSHRLYLRGEESSWLKYQETLKSQWPGNWAARYQEFMAMEDPELQEYLTEKSREAVEAIICGDKQFSDDIKMKYLHTPRTSTEIPQARKIKSQVAVKKIKQEVVKAFGIKEEELYRSVRGKENAARMMAIGLARASGGMSYKNIGEIFGGISYKSAAKYCERLKIRCGQDKAVGELFTHLRSTCSQVET